MSSKDKKKWSEQGAEAEKARMKRLCDDLNHRATEARKYKHPIHAARMAALAKLACQEYNRISKLKALDGLGDASNPTPSKRFGILGLVAAAVLGVVVGKSIK